MKDDVKKQNCNPYGKSKDFPMWLKSKDDASKQDPMWYADDAKALSNMASFPFSNPVGKPIEWNPDYDEATNTFNGRALPGIMTLYYANTFGKSLSRAGYMNKMADSYFAYATQGYTGTSVGFEAPDLVMYSIAVIELLTIIAEGKRAYGLVQRFSNYNDFLGRRLVEACGFDYDDLKSNLANFRAEINIVIKQIQQSFHIPKGFNYLERKIWLVSHIWADDLGKKFQMYVFRPDNRLQYAATELNTGTCLKAIRVSRSQRLSVAEYFEKVQELLGALQGDQDVNNMSGAILRVYKEEGCETLTELDEGFELPIEYSDVALSQIHNLMASPQGEVAYLNGVDASKSNIALAQLADGTIYSAPFLDMVDNVESTFFRELSSASNLLLDIDMEEPDPASVIDATRLMWSLSNIRYINEELYVVYNCMTEIITAMVMYSDASSNYEANSATYINQWQEANTDGSAGDYPISGISVETVNKLCALSRFEYHPFIYFAGLDATSGERKLVRSAVLGDINNFTLISGSVIADMNNRCFWALLKMPKNLASVTSR